MNNIDITELRSLIDRFLDGDTTLAEEKKLSDYFASGEVAGEFRQYAGMFGWYRSLSSTSTVPAASHVGRRQLFPFRQWFSAAALLAILFTAGHFVRNYSYDRKYMAFKGSYIVRDGKKITDLSIVGPEAERIQREFDERVRQAELAIRAADEKMAAMNMICGDNRSVRM